MFEHSIKVPRLYKNAAKILQDVKEKRTSLKQLIYQCKHRNLKAVYALVAETLKHFTDIDTVIEKTQLLEKENRFDPWLARILITEMVWKGKQISSKAKPIETINSYYDSLKQHKDVVESTTQTSNVVEKVKKPKYARVNTLKISLPEAINAFREEGWSLTRYLNDKYDEYIARSSSLSSEEFIIDIHIKELLLFPSGTQFYKHVAYKDGLILLQDKASCLAAHLLNPPPGSTVLDMCAAPGMKTTHLAALLNNEGTVYALELNEKRFKTLNEIVEHAGATCVKTIHRDATEITADDCPNVEYILVDPSCSGSGLTDRITVDNKEEEISMERLRKLANFQTHILNHALSNFPQVKRIVYSTCSIYPQENEHVISRVLERHSNFRLVSAIDLLNGLWTNSSSEDDASIIDKCLYAKTDKDLTNGFFIAVLEKINDQELTEDNNINVVSEGIQKRSKNAAETEPESLKKKKKRYNSENTHDMQNKTNEDAIDINIPLGDKNKKKRKYSKINSEIEENDLQENMMTEKKSKKKRKHSETYDETDLNILNEKTIQNNEASEKKSKKKSKYNDVNEFEGSNLNENTINDNDDAKLTKKLKHKKKSKDTNNESKIATTELDTNIEEIPSKLKTKKRKDHLNSEDLKNEEAVNIDNIDKKIKKKKHKKEKELIEENVTETCENNTEKKKKKKKKKEHKKEKELIEENVTETCENNTEKKKKKKKKKEHEKEDKTQESNEYREDNNDIPKKHKNKRKAL